MPGAVDAIVIRIPFKDNAIGGWPRLQYPGFEGWQIWIVIAVHDIHLVVQGGPVADPDLLHQGIKRFLVGIFLVELLEIGGRQNKR